MNVRIMMGHVNDLSNIQNKDAVIRETLGWVRHWQEDVACNLQPTPDSLAMVEAKLVAALDADTTRERAVA